MGFEKAKRQLAAFMRALDPSTKLLFAQKIAASTTYEGDSIIELLFDVFEQELIDMLDLSDATRRAIQKSQR